MKKLMLLGGSSYLEAVIKTAHELGIYVITADYCPDNIAHKISDEYCNVSVVDKDEVLKIAMNKHIDGIMSFACDPGVTTAAYVAEKMNLPFQGSYESTCILQDKGKFRKFLADNNFNVPKAKKYFSIEDAMLDAETFDYPVIVKPVDSAGSKGVTKIDSKDQIEYAANLALKFSISKSFIIEKFITFDGFHSSTDVFTVEGKVKFCTYSDQLFDKHADNPYTPAYIIWPSTMKEENQKYLTSEIQRLMTLLKMKTGIYNIETCVGIDGKPYIMEVSPRGGGCKIAEIQNYAYNVNLIELEIKNAVGLHINEIHQSACDGCWCELVVHSERSGILENIFIRDDIKTNNLKVKNLTANKGDYVHSFTGANQSLGDIFIRFNTRKDLDQALLTQNDWLKVELKEQ